MLPLTTSAPTLVDQAPPAAGLPAEAAPWPDLAPLGVYAILVVGLVALILLLSWLTGPRHRARRRDLPYESGMPATGDAHLRFPVAFYLVALAFLIFDIEAAFLLAWAVSAAEVGWAGYLEALVFTLVLLAGLVFLWGKGALDVSGRRRPAAGRRP